MFMLVGMTGIYAAAASNATTFAPFDPGLRGQMTAAPLKRLSEGKPGTVLLLLSAVK
jgi:hypothetical protein